jgi:hypothetical protein
MPITDIEWVFKCTNPKEYDSGERGICKGMVVLFILAVAGKEDDSDWFPEMRCGIFIDPDHSDGGFYVNAGMLHIAGQNLAARSRARYPDPDANELALVPAMYGARGLEATAITKNYVPPRRGMAVVEAIRDCRGSDWFHLSLRSLRGGHSIAVWRSGADKYLLFDPNEGAAQFMSLERFAAILTEEFKRAGYADDDSDGMYSDYDRVCVWSIDVSAAGLPPPPPPPHGR